MSAKITFYGATRKTGNPNTHLKKFLESIVANSANPSDIEVLFGIDSDDDMEYFNELEQEFQSISVKFIVSPVRHGYSKLHLYYQQLFKHISPTSRMLFGCSDDCQITLPQFDVELLKVDALYKDNIYFIHTRQTNRERYLGDVTENMLLLFWIQQAKEPASFFPIISRRVLDIAQIYADKFDKKGEWIPFANSWIVDCYIDILSVYVTKLGLNCTHTIANVINLNPNQVTADHHRPYHEFGLSPNNVGFIKMLSTETQNYLQGLALALVRASSFTSYRRIKRKVWKSLQPLRPFARAVRNNLRKLNFKES